MADPSSSGGVVERPSGCIEEVTVDHGNSVLQEQRRLGGPALDFPTRFASANVQRGASTPVRAVEGYRVDGTPILWFTPDKTAAVVSAAVFSDLTVADPTRMAPGDTATVGILAASARGKIAGRDVATFLIHAGAVRTYWHVGSVVCLEAEESAAGGYEATFSGVHTYFTDGEHHGRFRFTLRLAPDGTISVAIPP